MTKTLVKKWARALKSGKFFQGMGFLETFENDEFERPLVKNCCLGVLCRIEKISSQTDENDTVNFDENCYKLTYKLLGQFGLSYNEQDVLIHMNDSGQSFKKIAVWIETHLMPKIRRKRK